LQAIDGEIASNKSNLDEVILNVAELKKHVGGTSSEESANLDLSLDEIKRRYDSLSRQSTEQLGRMDEALPIVARFYDTVQKLGSWLAGMPAEVHGGQELSGPEVEKLIEVGLVVVKLEF